MFVDTSVLMYAAGGEHPLREPCRAIVDGIGRRSISAVTSIEVVQEILHRYLSIGRAAGGIALAEETMDLFAPVLPITHALMRRVPQIARRYPALSARDLIHVATCIHEGITEIISTDRGFDAVQEVRRIPPEEFAA
ncbi:MAG TPA: type II toxin-antitoxin system VapC family toxin [Candidatus Limnocylindrales bacterium]|nr:type II toxin-antitoxin system VapC family toxin [Candidatus Limnocylindrales bacterium]